MCIFTIVIRWICLWQKLGNAFERFGLFLRNIIKAHLEAEGHTAVQPSEFFLGEDSSSSLLIILRNEDIAEHIIEVMNQPMSRGTMESLHKAALI